jgi:hypothetical protein
MRKVAVKYARIFPLVLFLGACRASVPAPSAPAGFEILAQGYQSGEHEAGVLLINSAEEWHAFWQRHANWRIPAAPEPAVDFAQHSVIVVRAGDQPTAGFVLTTRSVSRAGGQTLVDAVLDLPATDAVLPQVVTQPYQILLVPRTSGTIQVKVDQRRINR